jgi:predicted TIM-barrel fold metal-dependent hydrolase
MILDAHTHLGKKRIIAKPPDLIASMDSAKIDKALVFAGKFTETATEDLLTQIAPYNGRLFGIGSWSPKNDEPTPERIEQLLREGKIHGMKFYPGYEYFYPHDHVLHPYMELLVKYDRPAIFHSGDTFNGANGARLRFAHPLEIDDLSVEFPKLKIIIAHLGNPWVIDAAEVCFKNENVYADCSGFVYGDFKDNDFMFFRMAVNEFKRVAGGQDKVIFGTDWPISHQQDYIQAAITCFDDCGKVMGTRAAELFGISK